MPRFPGVLWLLLGIGCSSDSGDGAPRSEAVASVDAAVGADSPDAGGARVSGRWAGTLTGLTDGEISCDVAETMVTLSQVGRTFVGRFEGGRFTCSSARKRAPGGGRHSSALGGGRIVNGIARGDSVVFDLEGAGGRFAGRLDGMSMAGVASVQASFFVPGRYTTLRGDWNAARR